MDTHHGKKVAAVEACWAYRLWRRGHSHAISPFLKIMKVVLK